MLLSRGRERGREGRREGGREREAGREGMREGGRAEGEKGGRERAILLTQSVLGNTTNLQQHKTHTARPASALYPRG